MLHRLACKWDNCELGNQLIYCNDSLSSVEIRFELQLKSDWGLKILAICQKALKTYSGLSEKSTLSLLVATKSKRNEKIEREKKSLH